jgi:hypothetical protein
MADRLICPVCGESNPADMEFCRNCQSRLQPLPGPLKEESGPIQPGELPTKKVTSELEPLLPQWLRDARQQARETAAEDLNAAGREQKEPPASSVPDLLDGLASQTDEEDEDIPDWLAQITGATSKKKKPASEDKQAKRVELGRDRAALPLDQATNVPPISASSARPPEKDELSDWFKQAGAASQSSDFRMPTAPLSGPPTPAAPVEPPATPDAERPAEDLSWLTRLDAASGARPETPVEATEEPAPAREEAPDWLKKLQAQQAPPPAPTPAAGQAPQGDVPDWLKQFDEPASISQPAEPAPSEPAGQPADFGVPEWLKELPSASAEGQAPEPQEPSAEPPVPAELPDWLSSLGSEQRAPAQEEAQPSAAQQAEPAEPAAPVELPGWISSLGAQQQAGETVEPQEPAKIEPFPAAELPDWISSLGTPQATPEAATEPEPAANEPMPPAELPDWIASLGTDTLAQEVQPEPAASETVAPAELPDWISSLGTAPAAPEAAPEPAADEPILPAGLPDWVSSLGGEQAAPQPVEPGNAASEPIPPAEPPDWISSLGAGQPSTPAAAEPQAAASESFAAFELPDWLSSLGTEQPAEQPTGSQALPEPAATPAGMPDWLSSLGEAGPIAEDVNPAALEPEEPAGLPAEGTPAPGPAVTPESLAGEDVDAVFASMKTPDWLSAVLPSSEEPAETAGPTPPAPADEPIAPAELPSWVQAMRPVESVGTAAGGREDALTIEERGPLAGLHGVLPTVPGAGEPSSKPKPQSFKLSATEQQLAHAALLERILAAETSPIPMRTGAVLRPQKMLRWFISAVMLLVLGGVVLGGSQFFALPGAATNEMPRESAAAITAVEAIPPDAPVLVVFDYQPSTVGEMEAAAGPLIDHMLLLNHPRLALLSTSPTGEALAERFMSGVLGGRGYVRDQQYLNLGYLPGGLAGVYNFARNPSASVPLDAQLRAAWQSSFLASVQHFSDFAAVIVLTDSLESGRTWVEQTALSRGNSTMVLVASAQAAPMLLPYVDSGQVNGMVSGLYGAVGVEQRNAGSPGLVRRYWDGYSVGLYLAVIMTTLGALWNLWVGIRDRRAQAVE